MGRPRQFDGIGVLQYGPNIIAYILSFKKCASRAHSQASKRGSGKLLLVLNDIRKDTLLCVFIAFGSLKRKRIRPKEKYGPNIIDSIIIKRIRQKSCLI